MGRGRAQTIRRGRRAVEVPDLRGLRMLTARAAVLRAGLVMVAPEEDPAVDESSLVVGSQRPEPGTRSVRGETVHVWRAGDGGSAVRAPAGPRPTLMRRRSIAEAEENEDRG